jgi:chromate reductase, NAD(P)H dehydrogenase (quinone)
VSTRLLTICGSLGPGSANRAALDVVEAEALAVGAEVHTDSMFADIPPFRPDQVDTPPASVAAFRRQIADAHLVVIASPEYAGGIAGNLKNALDWVVGSGDLYGKPVGALAAGSTGGAHALAQLALTLGFQGAQVVAQLGIAAPKTKVDDTGRFVDPATLDALREFTATVLRAASVG